MAEIDDTFRRQIRTLKLAGRARMREQFERAVCYLKGEQRADVERLLAERFPSSQEGDTGQRIAPVVMPIVDRYVAEAATIYNRTVKRSLVTDDGTPVEDMTKTYNQALERARYDEVMHANDRITVLLKTSCPLFEAKRGDLRVTIKYPHDVYPVVGEDPEFIDAADPDDYVGFVVELFWAQEDVSQAQQRTFVFLGRDEYIFYTGEAPDQVGEVLSRWPNPYRWPQTIELVDRATGTRTLKTNQVVGGRMLTFWHTALPVGELLVDTDCDIVEANRELNIAWSMLFDTLRFQSYGIPVLKTNKSDHKARMKWGARFPAVIGLEESLEMATAAVNYSDQVALLKAFSQQLAVSRRCSPNDFSLEGQAAISGFAKMVDSLPKIEARDDRIRRLLYLEQFVAWPRQAAVLVHLGVLPASVFKLRLSVEFDKISFPETQDERSKRIETDMKYNLTNPVDVLMRMHGLREDEAKEKLLRNVQLNEEFGAKPQPAALSGFGGMPSSTSPFGSTIRQRRSPAREEEADEGSAARRDRRDRGAGPEGKAGDNRDRRA